MSTRTAFSSFLVASPWLRRGAALGGWRPSRAVPPVAMSVRVFRSTAQPDSRAPLPSARRNVRAPARRERPTQPREQREDNALTPDALERLATEASGIVVLKGGRARLFRQDANALVYAAAVDMAFPRQGASSVAPGDPVLVVDRAGVPIAFGFYNPLSAFAAVRILVQCSNRRTHSTAENYSRLSRDHVPATVLDREAESQFPSVPEDMPVFEVEHHIRRRVEAAFIARKSLGLPSADTTVFRAINGEGDRLSGIAVDVFGSTAVVVSSALWVERFRNYIEPAVRGALEAALESDDVNVIWRPSFDRLRQDGSEKLSDAHIDIFPSLRSRKPEDSALNTSASDSADDEPDDGSAIAMDLSTTALSDNEKLIVREHGIQYVLPHFWLLRGQKSGFYADQSEHRRQVRHLWERRPAGGSVLDCYCYCGGFALSAALGGATDVTAVDSSATSLEMAKENAVLNGVDNVISWVQSDVPKFFHNAATEGKQYDMIIMDPPKLAPSKSVLERATVKYLKINAAAIRLVAPGGLLLTVRHFPLPCTLG